MPDSSASASFQPCWICASTSHRRRDCPERFTDDGARELRQQKIVCLGCRRRGHQLSACPDASGGGLVSTAKVCYNCGSSEHARRDCAEPLTANGAGFASCFVCKQRGRVKPTAQRRGSATACTGAAPHLALLASLAPQVRAGGHRDDALHARRHRRRHQGTRAGYHRAAHARNLVARGRVQRNQRPPNGRRRGRRRRRWPRWSAGRAGSWCADRAAGTCTAHAATMPGIHKYF